ncbi:hypothetical protein [Paenibacillus sp. Soil522]|uniref:hypothetical protein n=1 Tax=Paenibacillus sp. Soil522 TaxID=1736388 RepID=UPI0006FEA55F|nr:hypothetical protein [Paenibacillus sp. Soil522]KRE45377.1 hypothetical protein ASG81_13250 [Paenibacillus sp. Soil522]
MQKVILFDEENLGMLMQKKSEPSVRASRERQVISILLANLQGHQPSSLPSINWPLYRVLLLKLHSPKNNDIVLEQIKLKLERYFEDRDEGIVFLFDSKVGIVLRETNLNKYYNCRIYRRYWEILFRGCIFIKK